MAITSTVSKTTIAGNGSLTAFSFAFAYVSAQDIQVTLVDSSGNATLLAPSQYGLQLNPAAAGQIWGVGGVVNYPLSGAPISLGSSLTIARVLPLEQLTVLSNQGANFPAAIEAALDVLEMQLQQVDSAFGNAILLPPTDPPGLNYTVPAVAQRAGQMVSFDSSGDVIVAQPSSALVSAAMQPVVAAGTIAAAQQLLGISAAAGVPIGAELDWPGLIAPTQWFLEGGQAISRTGYPELFAVLAPVIGGTVSIGSAVITGVALTQGLNNGSPLEGTGIPIGATIQSYTSNSITMSVPATGNGTSFRVFPFGNGDGSTTYNLPDGRGYTYAGRDNMNGPVAGRLTTGGSGIFALGVNATGGVETVTLTGSQIPAHAHAGTTGDDSPDHTHTQDGGNNISANAQSIAVPGYVGTNNKQTGGASNRHQHPFTTNTDGGGGLAHQNTQPTAIRNKIIFAGRP